MAGDPPLNQVVAKTWEAGVRGVVAGTCSWNAGRFPRRRTTTTSCSSPTTKPASATSRTSARRAGRVSSSASRDAAGTLDVRRELHLPGCDLSKPGDHQRRGNSSNDGPAPGFDGNIVIAPGDRIPLIPRQMAKVFVDWQATPTNFRRARHAGGCRGPTRSATRTTDIRLTASTTSGRARPAATRCSISAPTIDPYRKLKLFVQINNLFDTKYYTAAQLGPTGFTERWQLHRPSVRESGDRRRASARSCHLLRAGRAAHDLGRAALRLRSTRPIAGTLA